MSEEEKIPVSRTIFGFMLALAGIIAFFTLSRTTRNDVAVIGAILLGGVYIDHDVMAHAVKIFVPFLPSKKNGENK